LRAAPVAMVSSTSPTIGHSGEVRPGTVREATWAQRFRWEREARRLGSPGLFLPSMAGAAAAVEGLRDLLAAARQVHLLTGDTVVPAPARTARARAARSLLRRSLASAALDHAPPGSRHMT
jgi:hypothetical protein